MESAKFQAQIRRMVNNWHADAYKLERVALFWKAFCRVEDDVFEEAVDELIANHRAAPMMKDIDQAIEEVRKRRHRNRPAAPADAETERFMSEATKRGLDELYRSWGEVPAARPADEQYRLHELKEQARRLTGRELAAGEGRET